MRIGIDVGGTNTDAVLVAGQRVLATMKTVTEHDITRGISAALDSLWEQHPVDPARISGVMVGTTHFINALVERARLTPTAAVRLGLPATAALPPMVEWPTDLVGAIQGRSYLCHGGHEYDGREISPLDAPELRRVADDLAAHNVSSVAITSVFSPVTSEFERQAADVLTERFPELRVSLSHEIGRMGLLERENATIVNAALRDLAGEIVDGLVSTIQRYGITAPLYLSQNDGTLMDVDFARRYPVATFASGPTNSMRGAAFLRGYTDCAVVDIGGTTSDIGIVRGGFPREAGSDVSVAGVRTNFRMPDVLSLGIGGGSLVYRDAAGTPEIGPESVGYELTRRSRVFGGDALTATDVAVAAGLAHVGDPTAVKDLDSALVTGVSRLVTERVVDGVDRMRISADPLPVVAVGGGSLLLPDQLPEGSDLPGELVKPDNYPVANAVGAAIAQVSGEVDRVFSVAPGQRSSAMDDARQEAVDRAVQAGAVPASVEVVDIDEVPIAYLPGNATRIRVKAVGDLASSP